MISLLFSSLALAFPQQLSQQGRLLEADNTPVEGTHNLTFRLYESPASSDTLWSESSSVIFTNGYYATVLGADSGNPLTAELLKIDPLYLELQLDAEAAMVPRQRLSAAPYSRLAGVAESVSGGSVDAATVAIGGALVIDSSGSWVGPTMALNWSDLAGVPAGFADGIDNDTQITEAEIETFVSNDPIDLALGSSVDTRSIVTQETPCSDGQILIYDFSSVSWICGADKDTNTQLSAEEIVTLLTNQALELANGTTVGGNPVLTDASTVSWGQLSDIPTELADGDDEGLNIQCAEGEILTYSGGTWVCSPFNTVIDADGDGALTWNDCDDSDPSVGNQSLDADCDGILSGNDCDDNDPSSTILAEDGDCDGLLAADDCNDSDSSMPSNDADCDGTLTGDDCNDADESMPSNDADCDGLLTADDCDDNDASMPNNDADCDGYATSDDCDDSDSSMPGDDADCDGYATANDCDDNDPLAFSENGLTSTCFATSCKSINDAGLSSGDGTYYIDAGTGSPFPVYCDMTTDGGGWTMVLMVKDGDIETFRYDSSAWGNSSLINESLTTPSSDENMKNQAYLSLAFSEIRLDLSSLNNDHTISVSRNSAQEILTGGHYDPGLSRDDYLNWHPESNSQWDNQPHCNRRGFQPSASGTNCRYGITMNNENECNSNDSAIGFGCHSNNFYVNRTTSAGGHRWNPDVSYPTRGWIFVR